MKGTSDHGGSHTTAVHEGSGHGHGGISRSSGLAHVVEKEAFLARDASKAGVVAGTLTARFAKTFRSALATAGMAVPYIDAALEIAFTLYDTYRFMMDPSLKNLLKVLTPSMYDILVDAGYDAYEAAIKAFFEHPSLETFNDMLYGHEPGEFEEDLRALHHHLSVRNAMHTALPRWVENMLFLNEILDLTDAEWSLFLHPDREETFIKLRDAVAGLGLCSKYYKPAEYIGVVDPEKTDGYLPCGRGEDGSGSFCLQVLGNLQDKEAHGEPVEKSSVRVPRGRWIPVGFSITTPAADTHSTIRTFKFFVDGASKDDVMLDPKFLELIKEGLDLGYHFGYEVKETTRDGVAGVEVLVRIPSDSIYALSSILWVRSGLDHDDYHGGTYKAAGQQHIYASYEGVEEGHGTHKEETEVVLDVGDGALYELYTPAAEISVTGSRHNEFHIQLAPYIGLNRQYDAGGYILREENKDPYTHGAYLQDMTIAVEGVRSLDAVHLEDLRAALSQYGTVSARWVDGKVVITIAFHSYYHGGALDYLAALRDLQFTVDPSEARNVKVSVSYKAGETRTSSADHETTFGECTQSETSSTTSAVLAPHWFRFVAGLEGGDAAGGLIAGEQDSVLHLKLQPRDGKHPDAHVDKITLTLSGVTADAVDLDALRVHFGGRATVSVAVKDGKVVLTVTANAGETLSRDVLKDIPLKFHAPTEGTVEVTAMYAGADGGQSDGETRSFTLPVHQAPVIQGFLEGTASAFAPGSQDNLVHIVLHPRDGDTVQEVTITLKGVTVDAVDISALQKRFAGHATVSTAVRDGHVVVTVTANAGETLSREELKDLPLAVDASAGDGAVEVAVTVRESHSGSSGAATSATETATYRIPVREDVTASSDEESSEQTPLMTVEQALCDTYERSQKAYRAAQAEFKSAYEAYDATPNTPKAKAPETPQEAYEAAKSDYAAAERALSDLVHRGSTHETLAQDYIDSYAQIRRTLSALLHSHSHLLDDPSIQDDIQDEITRLQQRLDALATAEQKWRDAGSALEAAHAKYAPYEALANAQTVYGAAEQALRQRLMPQYLEFGYGLEDSYKYTCEAIGSMVVGLSSYHDYRAAEQRYGICYCKCRHGGSKDSLQAAERAMQEAWDRYQEDRKPYDQQLDALKSAYQAWQDAKTKLEAAQTALTEAEEGVKTAEGDGDTKTTSAGGAEGGDEPTPETSTETTAAGTSSTGTGSEAARTAAERTPEEIAKARYDQAQDAFSTKRTEMMQAHDALYAFRKQQCKDTEKAYQDALTQYKAVTDKLVAPFLSKYQDAKTNYEKTHSGLWKQFMDRYETALQTAQQQDEVTKAQDRLLRAEQARDEALAKREDLEYAAEGFTVVTDDETFRPDWHCALFGHDRFGGAVSWRGCRRDGTDDDGDERFAYSVDSAAEGYRCAEGHFTVHHDTNDHVLNGTEGRDLIVARATPTPDDGYAGYTLQGFGGDDVLLGSHYADRIWGGDGDDWIEGRGAKGSFMLGHDILDGGAGDDVLISGSSDCKNYGDELYGGDGDDLLIAHGWGGEILDGGTGDDVIEIERYDCARIEGGAGYDTLRLAGMRFGTHIYGKDLLGGGKVTGIEILDVQAQGQDQDHEKTRARTLDLSGLTAKDLAGLSDPGEVLRVRGADGTVVDLADGYKATGAGIGKYAGYDGYDLDGDHVADIYVQPDTVSVI